MPPMRLSQSFVLFAHIDKWVWFREVNNSFLAKISTAVNELSPHDHLPFELVNKRDQS